MSVCRTPLYNNPPIHFRGIEAIVVVNLQHRHQDSDAFLFRYNCGSDAMPLQGSDLRRGFFGRRLRLSILLMQLIVYLCPFQFTSILRVIYIHALLLSIK